MHFAPPAAGLDLPCVVPNFMAIPAVTANPHTRYTVNVDIFAWYIFLRISRRVLNARKYYVSEKMNYHSANRTNC